MTKADQAEFVLRQATDIALQAVKDTEGRGATAVQVYTKLARDLGLSMDTFATVLEVLVTTRKAFVLDTDSGYCLYRIE